MQFFKEEQEELLWSTDNASETDDLIFDSSSAEVSPHYFQETEQKSKFSNSGNFVCQPILWKIFIFLVTFLPLLFYAKSRIQNSGGSKETLMIKFEDHELKYNHEYTCMSYHLNKSISYHITKFNSVNKKSKSRHVLLFGCQNPSFPHENLFRCGKMSQNEDSSADRKDNLPHGTLCGPGKSQLIFALSPEDSFNLPENTSFHLGNGSVYSYLVIQVYYSIANEMKSSKDIAGLKMEFNRTPTPFTVHTSLLSAGYGRIPSRRPHRRFCNIDLLCTFRTKVVNSTFTPIAFRTHAHSLGNLISGYYINGSNMSNWILIGRKSPQFSQTFYPIRTSPEFRDKDRIAVRCNYKTPPDHDVFIGQRGDDEMCNFYFMYYMQTGNVIRKTCHNGWRYYYRMRNLEKKFLEAETLTEQERDEVTQFRKAIFDGPS